MSETADPILVTLSPEARRAVAESVAAGEFATPAEAVGHAVEVWQRDREEETVALRQMVVRSLNDPRPSVPLDDAFTALRQRIAARRHGL